MRWGLTSNVRTLMIAAPAREIVSKVGCEPLYQPAEVQCPIWVIVAVQNSTTLTSDLGR